MKHLKLTTAVLSALLVMGGSALADDHRDRHKSDGKNSVEIDKRVAVSKKIKIRGYIHVDGDIHVDSAAMSTIDNKQVLVHNGVATVGEYNNASIGGSSHTNATGVIGTNVLSGDINLQANEAVITSTNKAHASVDAEVFNMQLTHHMKFINPYAGNNDASIDGTAYSGANGVIGVNVGAGHLNMQKNAVAIAHASNASLAEASVAARQNIHDMWVVVGKRKNHASIGGGSFTGAGGVVNSNVVSGTANQQLNAVSIAAVN